MPFRAALSGLNAASADLRVIGNNVANASTTGFKQSTVHFSDVFASSNLGSTANAIGSGVRIADIAQQFSAGNIEFTNNNLDLAIGGQGFFRLDTGGSIVYSRSGAFSPDREGFIVNSQGQRLTGYLADGTGNITGAIGNIQLDTSDIAPQATESIRFGLNLNASASVPASYQTSGAITLGSVGANPVLDSDDSPVTTAPINLVDSFGQAVNGAQLQFTHIGGDDWEVTMIGAGGTTSTAQMTIGTTGSVSLNWDPDGAAGAQLSTPLTVDVSSVTQVAGGGGTDINASADGAQQAGFDVTDATTYNNSTSLTIYDSLGTAHLATAYYRKTGIPNQWETYIYVDGQQVNGVQANGSDLLQFTSAGSLQTINGNPLPPASITMSPVNPGGGAADITLTMDYSTLSQFGGGFNVVALTQDGYSTGRMSGLTIDDTGVLQARFTNGQTRTLAQIALANFSNPQGLIQLGDTSWAESFESGNALVSTAGSSSLGLIESGALEGSNVDLTEQLVNMITAQRNFQANAQVISTADTITQTIINLR